MKNSAPKSMRTQIGIFGRTNVGKSSFINLITAQDTAIVSPQPGTTTDIVEKAMEFLPIGPVVFIDTAGIDDDSLLSSDRVKRTAAVFGRADVFVIVTENGRWGEFEEKLRGEAKSRDVPVIVAVNKTDNNELTDEFRERLKSITPHVMECSCVDGNDVDRETIIGAFKKILADCVPNESALLRQTIVSGLIQSGGIAVLVTPIDAGAPKGRLILPQVQTIRDILDGGGAAMVVKDSEYAPTLSALNKNPDIVICDSQTVQKVVAQTPPGIPLTTFSILFARLKGDLAEAARGAEAIGTLKNNDKVLIAEACAHHAAADDIGRVKIPNMLKKHTGLDLQIDIRSGRDYPENLEQYSLIIHCGACMLTRREMLSRTSGAKNKNVPITNYGVAISYFCNVLDRVIEPFDINL
ncbi:MAG: [FeFe] hydrogenase H-cluster maturation GTPase HydF [Chitinispirillales bacterium]|jgi:[FeFe] hydrogenase H-cluster maturation GTPase HydF|nr:[FeFe] hydrogenase H-cluster maturation GTPase HydF [Chitinispirillales bacterium]